MKNYYFRKRPLIAYAIIAFVVCIMLGWLSDNQTVSVPANCTQKAEGRISRQYGSALAVSFKVGNRQIYSAGKNVPINAKEGEQVTVWYNPSNPSEFVVEGRSSASSYLIWFQLIFGLIGFFSLVLGISQYAEKREKEKKANTPYVEENNF